MYENMRKGVVRIVRHLIGWGHCFRYGSENGKIWWFEGGGSWTFLVCVLLLWNLTRWATGIICVGLWYFVVDIDLWLLPSLPDVEGMGASLKYNPTIYHCPQRGGGGHAGGWGHNNDCACTKLLAWVKVKVRLAPTDSSVELEKIHLWLRSSWDSKCAGIDSPTE